MNEENFDKKLNTAVEEIRKITMTSLEKKRMLENVLSSPKKKDQPIKSPWKFFSFVSFFSKDQLFFYGSICCSILIFTGGLAFASRDSLPGDVLYSMKVGVVEPIHSSLLISTESKAEYESSLATTRMLEAEILAQENNLDASKEEKLNSLLSAHTEAFQKHLNKLNEGKTLTEEASNELFMNFQTQMNAHARILDVINGGENDTEQVKEGKISQTARNNAGKAKENIKNEEEKKSEAYDKKKTSIQSMIDSTDVDLDNNKNEVSPERQRIVKDTQKTLSEAKQFIKEADDENKKGDTKKAYSKLLDSESSAKEAGIFLNTGLNLKGKASVGGKDR